MLLLLLVIDLLLREMLVLATLPGTGSVFGKRMTIRECRVGAALPFALRAARTRGAPGVVRARSAAASLRAGAATGWRPGRRVAVGLRGAVPRPTSVGVGRSRIPGGRRRRPGVEFILKSLLLFIVERVVAEGAALTVLTTREVK